MTGPDVDVERLVKADSEQFDQWWMNADETELSEAVIALLDLIRRQDAALTAVRELADGARYKGIPVVGVNDIDRALASPDTTQEAGQ